MADPEDAAASRTMPVDPDRHYAALLGGDDEDWQIRAFCGTGVRLDVAQVRGAFVVDLDDHGAFHPNAGPLVVQCPAHGPYLGLLRPLARGPANAEGSIDVSMPVMLVPLADVEYVDWLGTNQFLAGDAS